MDVFLRYPQKFTYFSLSSLYLYIFLIENHLQTIKEYVSAIMRASFQANTVNSATVYCIRPSIRPAILDASMRRRFFVQTTGSLEQVTRRILLLHLMMTT